MTCFDCGKSVSIERTVPVKFGSGTAHVCIKCYYGTLQSLAARGYNPKPVSYGRIDWMPRKKVWRAIGYTSGGLKDLVIGDYPTYDSAREALVLYVESHRKRNPNMPLTARGYNPLTGWEMNLRSARRYLRAGDPNRAWLVADAALREMRRTDADWSQPDVAKKLELVKKDAQKVLDSRNPTAASLYEAFHGNPPRTSRALPVRWPDSGERMVAIGRLTELRYKPYGSSKRSNTIFFHKFSDVGEGTTNGPLPILATDADGKGLYIIKDKSTYKFSDRGILG